MLTAAVELKDPQLQSLLIGYRQSKDFGALQRGVARIAQGNSLSSDDDDDAEEDDGDDGSNEEEEEDDEDGDDGTSDDGEDDDDAGGLSSLTLAALRKKLSAPWPTGRQAEGALSPSVSPASESRACSLCACVVTLQCGVTTSCSRRCCCTSSADIATAHAAVISDLRAQGLLTGAEATTLVRFQWILYPQLIWPTIGRSSCPLPLIDAIFRCVSVAAATCVPHSVLQRRLFAAGDDAVRAAWRLYMVTEDREDLEDTLLRIVRSAETSGDDESRTTAAVVELVGQVEEQGLLSTDDAELVVALARDGNQVRFAPVDVDW